MRGKLLPVAAVLTLAGCESLPPQGPDVAQPHSAAAFLKSPDPAFRLSADDRARLHPLLDPDAVERLLAWVPPAKRDGMLLLIAEIPEDIQRFAGPNRNVSIFEITIRADDPEIDREIRQITRTLVRTGPRVPGTPLASETSQQP